MTLVDYAALAITVVATMTGGAVSFYLGYLTGRDHFARSCHSLLNECEARCGKDAVPKAGAVVEEKDGRRIIRPAYGASPS